MRCLLSFIIAIFLLIGCRQSLHESHQMQLIAIDSLLRNEEVDSALLLLERINPTDLEENNLSYYSLLLPQAQYKAYRPIKTDSLIRKAVSYYKQNRGQRKLAQSLLYYGCIQRELRKYKNALESFKEAEYYAGFINDPIIKHNIYFSLASINSYFQEKQLALDYIRKAILYTKQTGRYDHLAYDYLSCSIYHYNLKNKDSCRYYINKCYALIDHIPIDPPSNRAKILKSMGFAYFSIDRNKAKQYFEKSIELMPTGEALGALGRLYWIANDTINAIKYFSLSIEDNSFPLIQIENIEFLSQIEQKRGNLRRAIELSQQANDLKDSLNIRLHTENAKALQLKIEHKWEKDKIKKYNTKQFSIISLLLFVSICVLLFLMRKILKDRKKIENKQQLIVNLEGEHHRINNELNKTQKASIRLKNYQEEQQQIMRKLRKDWQQHEKAVEDGSLLFFHLTNGGKTTTWTSHDFKAFRTYYERIDKPFADYIHNEYDHLSPNLFLLAVLEHMGKTDEEMRDIMGISVAALRTSRSRLKKRKRS